jgi:hypothetical protein
MVLEQPGAAYASAALTKAFEGSAHRKYMHKNALAVEAVTKCHDS